MLAHTAYFQAGIVVEHLLHGEDGRKAQYEQIPKVIYSNPEVLTVGMIEAECVEKGLEYVAKSLPMTYSGKYYAEHGKDDARQN